MFGSLGSLSQGPVSYRVQGSLLVTRSRGPQHGPTVYVYRTQRVRTYACSSGPRSHAARKNAGTRYRAPRLLARAAARGPRACGSRSTSRRNRVTVRVRRLPAARHSGRPRRRAERCKIVVLGHSATRR